MAPVEIGEIAVVALVSGVLLTAATSDVKTRRIPNWTVLAVACLFVPWIFFGPSVSVVGAAGAAAIMFALTFGAYSAGVFGAGDSKLLTAVSLFAGLGHLLQLVLFTSLAGGLLGLAYIAMRPTQALVRFQLRMKGDSGGVPYGAAIAAGGVLTLAVIIVHPSWPFQ